MKKILLAVLIIGVVAAIAVGGTLAYFYSSNTIAGGFTAATFNVTADNFGVPLQFDGLVPGGTPVVHYVRVVNSGDVGAYIKADTGDWSGSSALLNALQVKVTLFGSNVQAGGGNYPDASANYVSYNGPLVGLHIDNVYPANNPIMPGQVGVYKVEVSLPFGSRDNSIQGASAGCDVLFAATQSVGQTIPSPLTPNSYQSLSW